jgi:hypothetical protein
MTFQFADGRNATLLESGADWVSPRARLDAPPVAKGAKVVISDSDHHCGVCPQANGDWVWKEFTRGRNPILMDPYGDPVSLSRTRPENLAQARLAMGNTRRIATRINLAAMRPLPALASTAYVLADPGREYVVYQPGPQPFTLDLAGQARRTFDVEWIAVASKSRKRERISGRGRLTLTPPYPAGAAAYLRVVD